MIRSEVWTDRLWLVYYSCLLLSFCCIGQIVSEVMLGCENLSTNICVGKNIYIPSECLIVSRSDRFNAIIAFFTFIVHAFVNIKIQIFKWKGPADQHKISQKTRISWRNFKESKFLTNVIMTTANSILLKFMAISPGLIKKFTFDENHDNVYDILNRLVRVPLTMLLILTNIFFFRRELLKPILKEFLDRFVRFRKKYLFL